LNRVAAQKLGHAHRPLAGRLNASRSDRVLSGRDYQALAAGFQDGAGADGTRRVPATFLHSRRQFHHIQRPEDQA
jgi:hypothetical protein